MFYEVMPVGRTEGLTYSFDGSLLPGQIVLVPLGPRSVPGVVVKKVAQPDFSTRAILKILYAQPLPRHLLDVVRFIHEYYLAPSGAAVGLILPKGVEKRRRGQKTEHLFGNAQLARVDIPLNSSQKKALEGLQQARSATKLLHGRTGSGKTNIYLKMALNAFKRQKSTILLVPEIALTGQLVQVFQEVFGKKVVVIHSKQTEAERHLIFDALLASEGPRIVIGPRSALFAPLDDLGLIVIDEEHEATYYQENAPKYSAIRVASFMAKELGIDLVLGSATPTVEDYYLAKRQNAVVEITERAKKAATRPEVRLVDFKNRDNFRKNRYFCDRLLAKISENLAAGRQTLIFHNRRGSSPLTICDNCGEEVICPNCFLPLTLHADGYVLRCHTCGFEEKVPMGCPKCGQPGLIHKGFGTKLLEAELKKLFPEAKVRRFDADNKKGEGLETMYASVREGEVDILVGTQTLAKGLDLPRLATVGVVQADAGLSLPDYVAEERTFQLLTQVMGRVGRGHLAEAEVFVQTYRPEHPVLKFAMEEDYQGFYEYLLRQRQKAGFPPFKFVMKLEITLKTERLAVQKVRTVVAKLAQDKRLIVSPPQPAFHERTVRGYGWQIIVRARSRRALVEACADLDKNFRVILDPPGLL
ncbi:primosomal protein N' [Candidatus Saccharibacteria bacterium]|nr:primosomal protein N' [Candidatus Saccharibacteria bacterium]MBR3249062.1 primosomal protein N' [Candidatus Saccharibacteria bacterium]